jgi:hypothetical protein
MARQLSSLIREGFARALSGPSGIQALACAHGREPALGQLDWQDMASLMHSRSVPATRQDDVLAAAIRCYRNGSRCIWAPVLLTMLAPAVIAMAARARRLSPEIEGEDLDQQAVLEALRACAEMPLRDGCRYVQRRVVLLANKRLMRWAAREHRHRSQLTGDELMEIRK